MPEAITYTAMNMLTCIGNEKKKKDFFFYSFSLHSLKELQL